MLLFLSPSMLAARALRRRRRRGRLWLLGLQPHHALMELVFVERLLGACLTLALLRPPLGLFVSMCKDMLTDHAQTQARLGRLYFYSH